MQWRTPGSGFYANLGQGNGEVNCQPRFVVGPGAVKAAKSESEEYFRLSGTMLKCKTMTIGVPRPGYMATFSASFARNSSGAAVKVGFVQVLLFSRRVAYYGRDFDEKVGFWRDPSAIGAGLLDCGLKDKPWFQGNSARLLPPTPGLSHSRPEVVHCGDNPKWTVPMTVDESPLHRVVLQNHFRLFAVAHVTNHFIPICRIEWWTDIQWHHAFPLLSLVRADGAWTPPAQTDVLITSGDTANDVLLDQIRRQ